MKVTIGKDGLNKTWQENFPKTTECYRCEGEARIAFVAYEGFSGPEDDGDEGPHVCSLHSNKGKNNYWLHDRCAVAVYFCRECLEPTALYNQA